MTGRVALTYSDYGSQKSNFSFNMIDITAANIVAQDAAVDAFVTAVGNVTLGLKTADRREYSSTTASGAAASIDATRELKWLCTYTDDVTGKAYRMEIPCPLRNANTMNAAKEWIPTDALWVAFQTAFENIVVSEVGNAVTLQNVKLVGRDL